MIALLATALMASVLFSPGTQAAERARADVECTPTDQVLVYDCMIMLTGRKSDRALDGVEFSLKADMSSMPMAHNVKPVKAMPTGEPGRYRARIELAMHGDWVLKLEISSPARDTIIHKMHFGAAMGESDSPDLKQGEHPME